MLEIMDSLIATAVVILGLSLVVQAMQQLIKQNLELKTVYMRRELVSLFSGSPLPIGIKERLHSGGAGKNAEGAEKNKVEIAEEIVSGIEDSMRSHGFNDLYLLEDVSTEKFLGIMRTLPSGPEPKSFDALKNIFEDTARWFELTKKAFQEHYTRNMKAWAFWISAVVVVGLNANIIDIYSAFSGTKVTREAAVLMGRELTSIARDSLVVKVQGSLHDTSFVAAKPDTQIAVEVAAAATALQEMLDKNSFHIIGWTGSSIEKFRTMPWYRSVSETLIGWIGMTLLVSLGAPFWYDLLKALMGMKEKLKPGQTVKTGH